MMFGIVFGVACLVGLIYVLWRRRFGRFCGGRHHRHGRYGTYRLFTELDTSPGQEKAIRSALGDFRRALSELEPRWREARAEVASTLREERFDGAKVDAALGVHATELARLTSALSTTLGRAHEALDPDQRRRLARLIEAGGHWPL